MFSCDHIPSKDSAQCSSCGIKYEHCSDGKMRRITLPSTCHDRKSCENTFVAFVRRLVGMELTRAGFPISFFEPFNWLLKGVETLEYCGKLRQINDLPSPADRLAGVTGVLVSSMQMFLNTDRMMSINPVLGETFELCRPDLGFRIISEQIVHHPPSFAFYLESVNIEGVPDNVFRGYGNAGAKATFTGLTVEARPEGFTTFELTERGEVYTMVANKWKVIVSNLLRGMRRFQNRTEGTNEVVRRLDKSKNKTDDGLRATIQFHGPTYGTNWLGGFDECVGPCWADGYVTNKKGEKLLAIYGKSNQELFSVPVSAWEECGGWKKAVTAHQKKEQHHHSKRNTRKHHPHVKIDHSNYVAYTPHGTSMFDLKLPNQKLLWRKDPLSATYNNDYYGMPKFAIQLNEPVDDADLPPTDTRKRIDMRILETGDLDAAGKHKFRIEEKQRADLRQRLAQANRKHGDPDPWQPLWFRKGNHAWEEELKDVWLYTGEYTKRDWSKCPDLGFQPPKSESG